MEISLNYFKCHGKRKIDLTTGITLMKGVSGSGKSAIIEAISWCLYGTTKGVDPWTNPQAKTDVKIKINNVSIFRQRRPTKLTITTKDGTYVDDVAQNIIDEMFGDKMVWDACGYVDEDTQNTILYLSSKQRQTVLNKITFTGKDPEEYIVQIKEKIDNEKRLYDISKGHYDRVKADYDSWSSKNTESLTEIKETGDPQYTSEELKNEIATIRDELTTLREKNAVQNIMIVRLKTIEEQLETMSEVEIDINLVREHIEKVNERRELFSKMPDLNTSDLPVFTEEDYMKCCEQEREYKSMLFALKNLNISKEILIEEISYISDRLAKSRTDLYPLKKRKEQLEEQLLCYSAPPSIPDHTFSQNDIMYAKEYERDFLFNSRFENEINRGNFTREETEKIMENERYYELIKIRDKILEDMRKLGSHISPTHSREIETEQFTEQFLYQTVEKERQLKAIEDGQITAVDFSKAEDIDAALQFVKLYGNDVKESEYTTGDFEDAVSFEKHSKIFQTTDLEEINNYIFWITKYRKYSSFIENYVSLFTPDVTLEEYEDIQRKAKELENLDITMKCPHCEGNVFLDGKHLVASSKKVTKEEKLKNARLLTVMKEHYKHTLKRKELIGRFGPIPDKEELIDCMEVKEMAESVREISEKELVQPKSQSREIESILLKRDAYEKLSKSSKKYTALPLEMLNEKIGIIRKIGKYPEDVEYSSAYIREKIEEKKVYEEYKKLKERYDSIEIPVNIEFFDGDIEKVRKLHKIYLQLKTLGEKPLHDSSYMIECNNQKESYEKYKELKIEYDSIHIPECLVLSPEEVKNLEERLSKLRCVILSEEPNHPSSLIRNAIDKRDIEEKLSNFPELPNLAELREKETIFYRQSANKEIRERLIKERELIVVDKELEKNIAEATESLKEYEYELNITLLYEENKKRLEELENSEKESVSFSEKVKRFEKLHRIAVDTVYQMLDNLIDDINNTIQEIVSKIFNDPIHVRLSMYKELKATHALKPEINIDISYRGGRFNNIKCLSKGERHRIIVAVTLALNRRSKFPLLMLDETLIHIEKDLIENVTQVLKEFSTHRYMGVIAYQFIEGFYDKVIEL